LNKLCLLPLLFFLSGFAPTREFLTLRSAGRTVDSVLFIKTPKTISTVKELCRQFKGRPVFVDLWATWCAPCLNEFKTSAALKDWLHSKGIVTLYVSFDDTANADAWKKIIFQYNLTGYHIMADKTLQDNFSILIWGAPGGINLPHYLIIDKDGNIVEKNVLDSGAGDRLAQKIAKDLKLN